MVVMTELYNTSTELICSVALLYLISARRYARSALHDVIFGSGAHGGHARTRTRTHLSVPCKDDALSAITYYVVYPFRGVTKPESVFTLTQTGWGRRLFNCCTHIFLG